MKRLLAMIKLHDWQLNEARRRVADLEALADGFANQIAVLDAEIDREAQLASASMQARAQWPAYADAMSGRRANLEASLQRARNEVAAGQEEVRLAFQELKKYEIALEARKQKAADELNRKETMALDEMALQAHRRTRRATER
jgi:flagellar export protein FliJ